MSERNRWSPGFPPELWFDKNALTLLLTAVISLIGWISLLAGISPAVGKHADARFTDRDLLVAEVFAAGGGGGG